MHSSEAARLIHRRKTTVNSLQLFQSPPYSAWVTHDSSTFHSLSCLTDWQTRCFLSQLSMSTGARDSLPPRVWVIWVSDRVAISFNGNAEFKPRFSRWLHTGKVEEICDLWFALGAKVSWSKITNGKENYRVLPRGNLEAIGAVGANLRPFSFGGSVEPLRWSAQPW